MKKRLVHGVGRNDSNEPIQHCKIYHRWKSMLQRCYSTKHKERWPTYQNCTVCDEWLTFSNFKSWVQTQEWEGKHLDKDILVEGNKMYSPETCVFVDHRINSFILDSCASRGEFPIGVYLEKKRNKYRAQAWIDGKQKTLGRFDTPEEAHQAWLKAKQEALVVLIEEIEDQRVVDALRLRYFIEI